MPSQQILLGCVVRWHFLSEAQRRWTSSEGNGEQFGELSTTRLAFFRFAAALLVQGSVLGVELGCCVGVR